MTDEEFEQQNEYEDSLQERINELEEENENKSQLGFALYMALEKYLEKQGLTDDIPSVIDQLVGKNCGEYANIYNEYKNQKKELALYKKALELASIFMEEKCDWNNNLLPVYAEKERIFKYFLQQAKEKIDESN